MQYIAAYGVTNRTRADNGRECGLSRLDKCAQMCCTRFQYYVRLFYQEWNGKSTAEKKTLVQAILEHIVSLEN